jgi:hypothetical protein
MFVWSPQSDLENTSKQNFESMNCRVAHNRGCNLASRLLDQLDAVIGKFHALLFQHGHDAQRQMPDRSQACRRVASFRFLCGITAARPSRANGDFAPA